MVAFVGGGFSTGRANKHRCACGRGDWRPDSYDHGMCGCELLLTFPMVKLLDFAERWDELEASDNPFAPVIMAQVPSAQDPSQAQTPGLLAASAGAAAVSARLEPR